MVPSLDKLFFKRKETVFFPSIIATPQVLQDVVLGTQDIRCLTLQFPELRVSDAQKLPTFKGGSTEDMI